MERRYLCHLLEIYNLQSKFLVRKFVDLYVQSALNFTYKHLSFQKFFRGLYPWMLIKGAEEGKGCIMAVGGWMPLGKTSALVSAI